MRKQAFMHSCPHTNMHTNAHKYSPSLVHEITDKCIEHEDNQNGNKYVINGPYVTDLQQLPVT